MNRSDKIDLTEELCAVVEAYGGHTVCIPDSPLNEKIQELVELLEEELEEDEDIEDDIFESCGDMDQFSEEDL